MDDRRLRIPVVIVTVAALMAGCTQPKRLKYLGDASLQYYRDAALQIDYADVCPPTPDPVKHSGPPHTLDSMEQADVWDLPLFEALQLAMSNSEILVSAGTFRSAANPLLNNPNFQPSVFDPAIQESGVLFGGRGVEAALADFDTQFRTSMLWGRDENVINNVFFSGGLTPGATSIQETGMFSTGLQKQFATGGQLALSQDWNYVGTNLPGQLFPSAYTGILQAGYRHPLLAGSGTEYTRIAGASGQNFGQITGVSQGVVIARINGDITLADFQASVRNTIRDVENLYWDLYLRYREFNAAVVARNSSLQTWRIVKAKADVGFTGGAAADEAQARDAYFAAKAASEQFLSQLYTTEVELRRLLGLPVNDGRIIRPSDDPLIAELVPDWYLCLTEALTERVELRKQKWNIKSLELQLSAAESLTRPRLDFVSAYRVNGFGNDLFGNNDDDGITAQGFESAYETLTQGNQTGWNLGFEFTMPIGFRSAYAQVRNLELRLAKARAGLARQELEISHELAATFQDLDSHYRTATTNFNRRIAAELRVQAETAKQEVGTATVDLVLRAQGSLADADIAYYTSLVRYNQSVTDLHFRKGTLLEHNRIHLAESEWTPAAYQDALRRAWARSHGFDAKHQHAEPAEFASPAPIDPIDLVIPAGAMTQPRVDSDLSGNHGMLVPPPEPAPLPGASAFPEELELVPPSE